MWILELMSNKLSKDPLMVSKICMHLLRLHASFYVLAFHCHLLETEIFNKMLGYFVEQKKS